MPYIDWSPFFQTWDLAGRFPAILDNPTVGEAARQVYADAQAMLARLVAERWVGARAVFALWPAASVGEDIVFYADEVQRRTRALGHLRQQHKQPPGGAT